MKRISLIILLALCCVAIADAKKKPFGNGLYWEISKDGTLTISGRGNMPDFNNVYHKKKRAPWFSKRKHIYVVRVEEGVTSIGDNAFSGKWMSEDAYNISKVVLPSSLIKIGKFAFEYNIYLRDIVIPNNVVELGKSCFHSCHNLSSVKLPNSLTIIGEGAFEFCSDLKSVEIPVKVNIIRPSTFHWCESLRKVTIPKSVTSIGKQAFSRCKSLTDINIPNSVTTIGEEAFSFCKELQSISVPSSVESIGERAFCGCLNIRTISIPSRITSIGDYAFGVDYKYVSNKYELYQNKILSLPDFVIYNPEKYGISKTAATNYMNGIRDKHGFLIMAAKEGKMLSKEDVTVGGKKYYKVKITDKGYTYSGKYQLITEDGKDVLGGEYDELTQTKGSLFKVRKNGNYGVMDITGKEIIPLSRHYTSLSDYDSSKNRFSYAMAGYKGECDGQGREISRVKVVPPKQNTAVVSSGSVSKSSREYVIKFDSYEIKDKHVNKAAYMSISLDGVIRVTCGDRKITINYTSVKYTYHAPTKDDLMQGIAGLTGVLMGYGGTNPARFKPSGSLLDFYPQEVLGGATLEESGNCDLSWYGIRLYGKNTESFYQLVNDLENKRFNKAILQEKIQKE